MQEMPHTRLALEMFPNNERETLTLLGCSISRDESHQHGEICNAEQLVHMQDGCQTVNSPITQEPNHLKVHQVSEWPTTVDDDGEASFSPADRTDHFCGIMEDDKSILSCLPSKDVNAHITGVHAGPITCDSVTVTSDQSVIEVNAAEKSTSPVPRVSTCDGKVGTEPSLYMPASTQTEDQGTRDKHVNTEVHMADLDYLAEEFLKLRMAKEEQTEEKKKIKSLGCKMRKECDCIQRAQQAELCLLALQYSMCTQHCWKLYSTSDAGQHIPLLESLPANIVSVLQQLESDYSHMREKILAGVPLEQLKPLSVDLETITTGALYIPAQIIDDVLGKVPSWSCHELHNTLGEEHGSPDNQSRNGCQHIQRKEQIKGNNKAWRAVTFVPQDRDTVLNANKHDQKQPSACKELNASEAWYDAEEVLEPTEPALAAETGQHPADMTKESSRQDTKSSLLYVSNLPCSVTPSDVMLWFENYHASEVSISALKNDVRVAIVMTGGPQFAEAAARELNGCSVQGHTLHVQHIKGDVGGSHSQTLAYITGPEFSQDTIKPQTSKSESSSTERKLITEPPLHSIVKIRKVVCMSPTAKGTYVPQHYGTMGSFDTLMAELTQRHPDVGRQRIVDALIELKAKHQGVLCSLPLRTIREMTSELLIRPASATQRLNAS
uniref:RNA-binding protein 44 isoform X2 n=1 Tax=Scatophagus argus TaxID=75038 RepID=UPI001ED85F61|nr:RNA-binding protein 44 isoform X2 [Scatophagus argus]